MSESNEKWQDFYDPYRAITKTESPYDHKLIEIYRDGWDGPTIATPHNLHPMMNVIGLKWRPKS